MESRTLLVIVLRFPYEHGTIDRNTKRELPKMTTEEIDALGVSTDLVTAARALSISKSNAYAAARENRFPCRVIRVGSRYVVPVADLKAVLGLA